LELYYKFTIGSRKELVVCNRLLKIVYFIIIMKETEQLVMLYKNNMWKLHGLLESVISDRGLQFVTNLIKKCHILFSVHIHSNL